MEGDVAATTNVTFAVADDGSVQPESRVPDDLDAALHAVRSGDPAGAKRLAELLHNHAANKLEALDRGALAALTALLESAAQAPPPLNLALSAHAMAALRSLCFRNDEARNAGAPAMSASSALLGRTMAHLDGDTGEDTGNDPPVNPWLALALLDSTLMAMVALAHAHPANSQAAVQQGAREHVARVQAALPSIAWPPTGPHADAHGDHARTVLPASLSLTPARVAAKALMLEACLGVGEVVEAPAAVPLVASDALGRGEGSEVQPGTAAAAAAGTAAPAAEAAASAAAADVAVGTQAPSSVID